MSRHLRMLLLTALLAVAMLALAGQRLAAQPGDLDAAAQAVVRILACDPSGCRRGVGSGVIIDPSGIILTANHVTLSDPNNQLSLPLNDFLVELTTDARHAPEARYRAHVIASDRDNDLALLQVDWDELKARPVDPQALSLPALSLLDTTDDTTADVGLGESLQILGYPLVGGRSINVADQSLSGFVEESLMKVTGTLGQGYSGGPALVVRDGQYAVAGVVIRQRDLALGRVGLIRGVEELPGLTWDAAARRVWVDNVDVVVDDPASISIDVTLETVGYAGRHGRILAYLYDGSTRQPWRPDGAALPTSASGQVVLGRDFTGTSFIDHLDGLSLTAAGDALVDAPEDLTFRLVVWDMGEMKALWRDPTWRKVEATTAVAIVATDSPVPTAVEPATVAPTTTSTKTPTPTDTHTVTPLPPTATSTVTPSPESTATPAKTPIAPSIIDQLTPKELTTGEVAFVGLGEPGAAIELLVDGAVAAGTVTDAEGVWSVVVELAPGEYAVSVQAQMVDSLLPAADAPIIVNVLAPEATPTSTVVSNSTATDTPQPTATATPTPTPAEPAAGELHEFGGIPFVYVPAGEFIMGSSDEQVTHAVELCNKYYDSCARSRYADEQPQHTVDLDAFWMMQTEVTNAQWARFLNAGGYTAADLWSEEGWQWRTENDVGAPGYWEDERYNGGNFPVVGVSSYEAEAFANWLSRETGQALRLPTEAEWEKAARGTDGRIYPWGDVWDTTRVNYCDRNCGIDVEWKDDEGDDGQVRTAPVGSYPDGASPYGALDMAGNVWEWTADWYDDGYYAGSPGTNPTGPASGTDRVVRGGAWNHFPSYVRAAHRGRLNPEFGYDSLGLRLVVSSPGF